MPLPRLCSREVGSRSQHDRFRHTLSAIRAKRGHAHSRHRAKMKQRSRSRQCCGGCGARAMSQSGPPRTASSSVIVSSFHSRLASHFSPARKSCSQAGGRRSCAGCSAAAALSRPNTYRCTMGRLRRRSQRRRSQQQQVVQQRQQSRQRQRRRWQVAAAAAATAAAAAGAVTAAVVARAAVRFDQRPLRTATRRGQP